MSGLDVAERNILHYLEQWKLVWQCLYSSWTCYKHVQL